MNFSIAFMRSEQLTMRCIFAHQWATDITSVLADRTSVLAYRHRKRCGTIQRSIYDAVHKDVAWETIGEREFIRSQQNEIVRKPSSRLDPLAHTLGLRRSRMSDRRD